MREQSLLRLSSPRHVALHKTRDTATDPYPRAVSLHGSLLVAPYDRCTSRSRSIYREISPHRRGVLTARACVRENAPSHQCRANATKPPARQSPVNCRSAACGGHGTPPRVINPHHRPASNPLGGPRCDAARHPYALFPLRRECHHRAAPRRGTPRARLALPPLARVDPSGIRVLPHNLAPSPWRTASRRMYPDSG